MSTRSLKTWLPPGAHVAKPATNMSFLLSLFFYGLNRTSTQTSSTAITGRVSDTLTWLSDIMNL